MAVKFIVFGFGFMGQTHAGNITVDGEFSK